MTFMKSGMNFSSGLLSWLSLISYPTKELKRQPKVHDYSKLVMGSDYVFESLNTGTQGCITGFGKGVKSGDFMILKQNNQSCRYQVEEINYYSDPSDMWIALLK
jgi:hypothetical protein